MCIQEKATNVSPHVFVFLFHNILPFYACLSYLTLSSCLISLNFASFLCYNRAFIPMIIIYCSVFKKIFYPSH